MILKEIQIKKENKERVIDSRYDFETMLRSYKPAKNEVNYTFRLVG